MKIKLNIKPDEPTVNNRIYPKDVLLKAFAAKKEFPVVVDGCKLSNPSKIPINDIVGTTSLKINELNEVVGEVEIIHSPKYDLIKDIPNEKLTYTVCGFGRIQDNIITDFQLAFVSVGLGGVKNNLNTTNFKEISLCREHL